MRKPPHLGTGPYTEIERRVYLPQWLQHEFFHHLFRSYPEFGLETSSHQWFDRSKWPSDFDGAFEPDYYAEALKKRLQTTQAQPPLHIKLRYDAPPDALNAQIQEKDFLGQYQRKPVTNGYHDGQILKGNGGSYIWKNKAGVSWTLTFTAGQPGLQTDASCPYHGKPLADYFLWEFKRDQDGQYTTALTGFSFLGELYQKVQ